MKFELKYLQVTFIFAHSKTPAKILARVIGFRLIARKVVDFTPKL